jgi:transcription elongation factor Elf1
MKKNILEFCSCPRCGAALIGKMQRFFVCPHCGKALCQERKLADFKDKYCGNCGGEIASAVRETLRDKG